MLSELILVTVYVDPRGGRAAGEKKGRKEGRKGWDAHESSSSAKVWNQLWRLWRRRRKHKWIPWVWTRITFYKVFHVNEA